MKIHSCVLAAGIVIAGLAGCSSPLAPYPSLRPVMANPPPQPVPVVMKEEPATTTPPYITTVGPVPGSNLPGNVGMDGSASVPGAADPWLEIKDFPFDRRADLVTRVDTSASQLSGAVSVARLTTPKPDMDEAHATAIRKLDIAMTAVDQTRAALSYVDADASWEGAKNDFHAAWQNAQAAYAQVRATGN